MGSSERLPFAPLLPFLEGAALEAMARADRDVPLDRPHTTVMGRLLGVQHRQLYRLMESGVTHAQADELAGRLGLNPANIWPDWNPSPAVERPSSGHGHIRRRGDSYEVRVYLSKRVYGRRGYATVSVGDLAEAERVCAEGIERAARGELVVLPRLRQPRWRGMVRQRGRGWEVRVYLGRDRGGGKLYFTRTLGDELAAQRLRTGVMIELEASGATGPRAMAIARSVEKRIASRRSLPQ